MIFKGIKAIYLALIPLEYIFLDLALKKNQYPTIISFQLMLFFLVKDLIIKKRLTCNQLLYTFEFFSMKPHKKYISMKFFKKLLSCLVLKIVNC